MKRCFKSGLSGMGIKLTLQNTKGLIPFSDSTLRRAIKTANAAIMLVKRLQSCVFINLFR